MKNYKILFLTIVSMLTFSCIKDKTSPLTYDFEQHSIEGVKLSDIGIIGQEYTIEPIVNIPHIKDENDLQYFWVVTVPPNNEKDTISREKNLKMTVSAKYGDNISCMFYVWDKKNDIRYSTGTTIKISSPYDQGLLILSDKGNNGSLSFLSTLKDENKLYLDLYEKTMEKPMPKGKRLEGYMTNSNHAFTVILKDKPEESFYINGKEMAYQAPISSLFKTLDFVNGPFMPDNISTNHTTGMYGISYILANKKIYAKTGSGSFTSSFFGPQVEGDYEVGSLFGTMGVQAEAFVTYDYKNKRYIFVHQSDVTSIRTFTTPVSDGNAFDISNIDVKPVWMGSSDDLLYKEKHFVSIVKNKTGAYQLHIFKITYQRVDGAYKFVLNGAVKCIDLPQNVYNENCHICSLSDILYIANDKKIFRYSLQNFGNFEEIITMDNPITCISIDASNSIAVGTNTGTGELPGKLTVLSTAGNEIGKVLLEKTNVGGVIRDIIYKPKP